MTVLTFPSSPTQGQRYDAPNDIQYVFDGVKWIVETVTNTSEAISNSVQDRVAPMFVNGESNGITFEYDSETNTFTSTITNATGYVLPTATGSVLGGVKVGSGLTITNSVLTVDAPTKLVNGLNEVVLGANGTLTVADDIKLPAAGRIVKDCGNSSSTTAFRWINIPEGNDNIQLIRAWTGDPDLETDVERAQIRIDWHGDNDEYSGITIRSYDNSNTPANYRWRFRGDGDLQLPDAGDIVRWNGSAFVSVLGGGDRLVNGANEVVLNSDGSLAYPNSALQKDTGSINCQGNTSTVVYTASGQGQHTIKLLIQVEGVEGLGSIMDTQACEMIIAKSFRADDIASSVYGVVHTSVSPLATFTAEWNALANRVEVICTTPSANNVNVKTFATEISTSD